MSQLLTNLICLIAKNYINFSQRVIQLIGHPGSKSIRDLLVKQWDSEIQTAVHTNSKKQVEILLHTPNSICDYRYRTFSEKEPEILNWIEKYGGDGALYDIGANVGLYSLYYAKVHGKPVVSFEPSVFNLRQLAKNIHANGLEQLVTIISNPLSEVSGSALFLNGTCEEGGALNSFGVDYGFDGNPLATDVRYTVLGFSLDDLLAKGYLDTPPSLIKIDVDGIEHLILKGSLATLSDPNLKSIFIEVDDSFKTQSEGVTHTLETAGFKLIEKTRSELISNFGTFDSTYNQIWVKSEAHDT